MIPVLDDHLVGLRVIVLDDLGLQPTVAPTLADDSQDLLGRGRYDDDERHDDGPGLVEVEPHGELRLVHDGEAGHDARDEEGEEADGAGSADVGRQLGRPEGRVHLVDGRPSLVLVTWFTHSPHNYHFVPFDG